MTPTRAVLSALLIALAGCQSPQAPTRPASMAPAVDYAAQARAAAARSDWNAAAPLFRQAVAASPNDYALRYELGVAATHLDARDEAVREFRWVVANAPADSREHTAAQRWLTDAGRSTTAAGGVITPAPAGIPHVERVGDAGLYGQVLWTAAAGGPHSTRRMQVHLTGVSGTPSQEQRYTVRTDDEGKYEFRRIVPGSYKLADRVAGIPTWRLRVEVEAGRDTALDLNPANSVTVRDDFPE